MISGCLYALIKVKKQQEVRLPVLELYVLIMISLLAIHSLMITILE